MRAKYSSICAGAVQESG